MSLGMMVTRRPWMAHSIVSWPGGGQGPPHLQQGDQVGLGRLLQGLEGGALEPGQQETDGAAPT
jgi:hypothetical protein